MPASAAPARLLVIRGGALGDFLLTLPAIRLLREAFPAARLEILGYRQFLALAEGRFYADACRSIEYGPLAAFFARDGLLPDDLVEYFGGFAHVFSYLYDPDGIFEANVRRTGVRQFVAADPRPPDGVHAAYHLARPMERYALFLEDPAPTLHLTDADRTAAERFLDGIGPGPLAAFHPGSGGARKNWSLRDWLRVVESLPGDLTWIVTGGEAHADLPERALGGIGPGRARLARNLPLTTLAAVLQRCRLFLGNDSGVSHLAAATGIPCVLVFGPTDPAVWAPCNPGVRVVNAPGGDLATLDPATVIEAARAALAG